MSTVSLREHPPAPAHDDERQRLHQFAVAMARRDRSSHRRWRHDEDVERAIRGYAYAAAMAEHRVVTLTGDDLDSAISAYREARHLPVQRESSQRTLIAFADGGTPPSAS